MQKLLILCLALLAQEAMSQSQSFFAMGTGVNNKVYAIEEGQTPNTVYAAGTFTLASGNPATYVAQWDGNAWNAVGGGINYFIWDLIYYGGQLHAGGGFNTVNGSTIAWGMAKWNGTAWAPLANGIHGEVYALEKYNGDLYAAGFIDTLSGFNTGRGIMKWNGTVWSSVGGAPGNGVAGPPGFRAYALKAFNGELYVGGDFVTANGITVNNIAKWNGTSWSAIGSGTNGPVRSFGIHNNELYVGGDFTMANGQSVDRLAKLSGTTFTAVGGGANGAVLAIGSYMNELYVTGAFTMAGAVAANNIARWNGTVWKDLIGGLNFEGYCLTPIGNTLYVGGFYSVIGATITNNIAGWVITTGTGNSITGDGLNVFPNPASDVLFVETKHAHGLPLALTLYDASGKRVRHSEITAKGIRRHSVNVDGLPAGLYLVKVSTEGRMYSVRIVIG